jgi:hypothetical protein
MLPEHRLLKGAAEMPALSQGFRDRVLVNVHQQARYGRWADRLRIVAATAAALLLVTCVWTFRQNRPTVNSTSAERQSGPSPAQNAVVPDMSTAPSSASHAAAPAIPIELQDERKRGGGGQKPRQNLNEMQQINQLIEHYQQRQNAICGLLPVL